MPLVLAEAAIGRRHKKLVCEIQRADLGTLSLQECRAILRGFEYRLSYGQPVPKTEEDLAVSRVLRRSLEFASTTGGVSDAEKNVGRWFKARKKHLPYLAPQEDWDWVERL